MTTRRRAILLLGLAQLLGVPALAQPVPNEVVYRAYLNPDKPDNTTDAMALTFKAELRRASSNRIQVEIFPEGHLGSDLGADGIELLDAFRSN